MGILWFRQHMWTVLSATPSGSRRRFNSRTLRQVSPRRAAVRRAAGGPRRRRLCAIPDPARRRPGEAGPTRHLGFSLTVVAVVAPAAASTRATRRKSRTTPTCDSVRLAFSPRRTSLTSPSSVTASSTFIFAALVVDGPTADPYRHLLRPGCRRLEFDRDQHFRCRRRLEDVLARGRPIAANEFLRAVHHGLRRVDAVGPPDGGVLVLPRRELGLRVRVAPSQPVPVVDVEAQPDDLDALDRLLGEHPGEQTVCRRAAGASLGGEQLHEHGRRPLGLPGPGR